jgi:hypothetical protein
MSRTPITHTSGNATTNVTGTASNYGNQTSINATRRTTYNSTTIGPEEDYHIVVPANTIAIRLDQGEKTLSISDYLITIINASSNSLEYQLEQRE